MTPGEIGKQIAYSRFITATLAVVIGLPLVFLGENLAYALFGLGVGAVLQGAWILYRISIGVYGQSPRELQQIINATDALRRGK